MRTHCFRLVAGDDLKRSITRYAAEHGIDAAAMVACVGCLTHARLRDATGKTVRELDEPFEIVSLTGTVSRERTHLHIALSRTDLSTVGGHLMDGCIVNTTAEIVLCELDSLRFSGAFDPNTGYDELVIEPAKGRKENRI